MAEFPALVRWQERIDHYRAQQDRQGPPLWEEKNDLYDRWVEENNYHQKVIPYLATNSIKGEKILEIGPGTGAFTIPLAEAGAEILCLEPSRKMCESLEAKLDKKRLSNVTILQAKVEDSLDVIQQRAPFQQTLASFSLYNVQDIARVLNTLLVCSQRINILLGTGVRSYWYQALIRKFGGEEPVSAPQLDLLYPLLLEMGIVADVRIVPASQNYLYENEQVLVDYWQARLNTISALREDLAHALKELMELRNGKLGIFQSRPLALVVIERQKQIQNSHHLS